MKVFLSVKYHQSMRNRPFIEAVIASLNSAGIQVVCAVRDFEDWGKLDLPVQELMTRTFDAILDCDLVLVEQTEKGTGLGIEAGYAHAHQIPVMTIARQGSEVSHTLKGISQEILYYQSIDEIGSLVVGAMSR